MGVVLATAMTHDLFHLDVSVIEKALRTAAVYGGIVLLLRLGGKRDLAQLNSFDLVVLLLLSNVVQNAVIGPDNSLLGGLLGAALLMGINAVVVRLVGRSELAVRLIEGSPTCLIREGELDMRAVTRLGLSKADVMTAIHRQGAGDLSEVKKAELTPGGGIVVDLFHTAMNATKGDLARLEQKIDRVADAIERRQPG